MALCRASTCQAARWRIKYVRQDSGNVACGAREIAAFILRQVEYYSKRKWDGAASRAITKDEWLRAARFLLVLRGSKVRAVLSGGVRYHVCNGKTEARSEDENLRDDISEAEAARLIKIFDQLGLGREVSHADLTSFVACRAFWREPRTGRMQCTCPAFGPDRRCKHI